MTTSQRRWPLWLGGAVTLIALLFATGPLLSRAGFHPSMGFVSAQAPAPSIPTTPPSIAPAPSPIAVAPDFDPAEIEKLIAAGATARASELLTIAEKSPATRPHALALHARLETQRNNFTHAATLASEAVTLGGGVDALLARAEARLRNRDFEGAEHDFRAVLLRAPRNGEALDGIDVIDRSR